MATNGQGGGLRIVKSKLLQSAMMPMTAEEAVQRMDLLGHGFFFTNQGHPAPLRGGLPP